MGAGEHIVLDELDRVTHGHGSVEVRPSAGWVGIPCGNCAQSGLFLILVSLFAS